MKRIDLFQLMNAFQDEEFEPEEECFVDENKVKETVLTQVRQKKRKGRKVLVRLDGKVFEADLDETNDLPAEIDILIYTVLVNYAYLLG